MTARVLIVAASVLSQGEQHMGRITHGSESFFVLNEGVVSTAIGGRSGDAGDDVTEGREPVAQAVSVPPFRFSRLGPKGTPRLSVPNLTKVVNAMTKGGGGQTRLPARFTYLGQFIDHDLTFDATTVARGEDVSPAAMLQGRSPSLDLD